jgi:hypothetical protein
MRFGQRDLALPKRASPQAYKMKKVAGGGSRIELTRVLCRVWTDGEGELERQSAVFEIQDILVEGLDKPGEPPGRILTEDVKKKK